MRRVVALAALVLTAPTLAETDPPPAATPAAAILAAVSGDVKIERPGGASPLAGRIGMRLQPGDTVRVGDISSATLYLAGGGIVRIPAGSRIEIPKESTALPGAVPAGTMSSRSVEILEAGLWILNDPQGSILLSAMRGEGDDWSAADGSGPVPLSPRFENILEPRPRFLWTGDGPVRVVLGRGKEVLWRSAPAGVAPLTLPDEAPELRVGQVYRWWLEAPDGSAPLSETVPFRLADRKTRSEAARFEKEVESLARSDDGPALASFLRAGYYVQLRAWGLVAAAASDLRHRDPASPVATLALEGCRQQMRLNEIGVERVVKALGGRPVSR